MIKVDDLDLILQEEADPRELNLLEKINTQVSDVFKRLQIPFELPKIFPVKGEVNSHILSMPPVEIDNWDGLKKEFQLVNNNLLRITEVLAKQKFPDIKFPEIKTIKQEQSFGEFKEYFNALQETLNILATKETKMPKKMSVDVVNFPPQMVPQPVTHISINALQGYIKTSNTTVGTTLTPLPGYGILADRRSVYVYNNSSNTIYVGGSDVTTSNGIPVPPNSTSPIVDAGDMVVLYGIASTGSNDIRVMEVSDEASGR